MAAHSLYEQNDPYTIIEPEGRAELHDAVYEQVGERTTRISGARWVPAEKHTLKMEGARKVGHRAILLCGAADPRFIEQHPSILEDVKEIVRELVCEDSPEDYTLHWHVYGVDGVTDRAANSPLPAEVCLLIECIAPTPDRATEVVKTMKQYLLHYGYTGRLSTGGNVAFPFTPPEISVGEAYKFNVYHIMETEVGERLFTPQVIEF